MNGTADHSPHAHEVTPDVSNKRKRDSGQSHHSTSDLQRIQTDILEILKRQDTQPSFLQHEFLTTQTPEPATKKAKLSQSASTKTSISAKLDHGEYHSLDDLRQDAARVSKELVSDIRMAEKTDGQASGRPSVADLKRIQKIGALEQSLLDILDREKRMEAADATEEAVPKQENGTLVNGHVPAVPASTTTKAGTVLTLFGNAPTPKQLFSSMQHPRHIEAESVDDLELPVEEMSLPNGLAATKILPSGTADLKPTPTFEEAFPPPYSLPQLHPPKAQKRASTRDNSVTWEFKDPVVRNTKRGGYTTQTLSTADWLGWGGVDPVAGAEPEHEKRKQRHRALSGGVEASREAPSSITREAELVQQEEALFRRAFSSFAPTHDDTKSLVPAKWKSMVWFSKLGSKRFDQTFAEDAALSEQSSVPMIDPALFAPEVSDDEFGKVAEDLDETLMETAADPVVDNTDVEKVILRISELLETLASHQRIRNATITANPPVSRTPISPAPILASRAVKADSPADDEVATYTRLRHELAYLVLKLPPYAVAKLDGSQLADLGISTLLPITQQDYQGSMEEDTVSRAAKYAAAATANSLASLTRGATSSTGQHYSSSSSRTPAIGAAANTRYAQSSGRPSSTVPAFSRSTSGQGSYNTPTAASRATYAQPTQYTRPGAPQSTSTYAQPNGQSASSYYSQSRPQPTTYNSSSYGTNAATSSYAQQSSAPQPARPVYSASQPLQQFRAQSSLQNHNLSYSASPKPNYASTPTGASLQTRPSYGNGTPAASATNMLYQPGAGSGTGMGEGRGTPGVSAGSVGQAKIETPVNGNTGVKVLDLEPVGTPGVGV
ncbi:hypothetical protein B0A48_08169 [Cryoendolithus antarcticus]|uniref:Uncharacterized protein n=1 Tax=Cryoendolithus antarcticus TaxID=1507870 RepID=A0A1V8T1G7_9PEZI|nr:hypothetical protein B0A48_08169 [Cryoendolithus antarcticus]